MQSDVNNLGVRGVSLILRMPLIIYCFTYKKKVS